MYFFTFALLLWLSMCVCWSVLFSRISSGCKIVTMTQPADCVERILPMMAVANVYDCSVMVRSQFCHSSRGPLLCCWLIWLLTVCLLCRLCAWFSEITIKLNKFLALFTIAAIFLKIGLTYLAQLDKYSDMPHDRRVKINGCNTVRDFNFNTT